jgi:hypothetical protein
VTHDRRHLKAAREVERRRRVVERRLDVLAVADIERQLDPRVHLRLVHLREAVVVAPVEGEERPRVDRVRRIHTERVQPVAVEGESELVRELDGLGRLVVAAVVP